jgi:hypothetical protein
VVFVGVTKIDLRSNPQTAINVTIALVY